MNESVRITNELDAVAAVIDASQGLVSDGKVIDLAGLDQRVDKLCADIAAQPGAQNHDLKGRLIAMIESLDRLVASLEGQHKELSEALRDLSDRQRALTAYGTGAGRSAARDRRK